jgi:ribosomal protein S18 acetylase RimI-like enzyme
MTPASIRQASTDDIEAITALHKPGDAAHRLWIARMVQSGCCYLSQLDERIAGYGVLEYSFFGNGFVSMLYVAEDSRRRGIASELMRHMQQSCRTPKLFCSTNRSNTPMQLLLLKLGYQCSGVVDNLDEGDPELFFFKRTG